MKNAFYTFFFSTIVLFAVAAEAGAAGPAELCGDDFTNQPVIQEITKNKFALCSTLPTSHVTVIQAAEMAKEQNRQQFQVLCPSGFEARPVSKTYPRRMGVSVITRIQCK